MTGRGLVGGQVRLDDDAVDAERQLRPQRPDLLDARLDLLHRRQRPRRDRSAVGGVHTEGRDVLHDPAVRPLPELPGAAVIRRASEMHERGMTEGTRGCVFVVFTLCLNDNTALKKRKRTAFFRAEPTVRWPPEDGQPAPMLQETMACCSGFAGRQRTDGPRQRTQCVVQRTDGTS